MPTQLEQTVLNPEEELVTVKKTFQKLAPACGVERRARGIPQLAIQEKQISTVTEELKDTLLCINLAKKGQHAIRDAFVKRGTKNSVMEYENLNAILRDEQAQLDELEILNRLAKKQVVELLKKLPTEADELAMIENANNRLRQMENHLELATKRFGVVNADNKHLREEIDRLLIERNEFNIQWNRTIGQLVKAKEYLMDILEIATTAFNNRDECCRKLEALKWKGLFNLNKDISEMQTYEGELNHLAKLEEFIRIKCSRRLCEADEKDEMKRLDEIERCENEIARYDEMLNEIFAHSGSDEVGVIISRFQIGEIQNFSTFQLLCEYMQESIVLRRELDELRRSIVDQREMNEARTEMQQQKLIDLSEELDVSRERTQNLKERDANANALIFRVLKGIESLIRLTKSPVATLVTFLGNHKQVTKWNVMKFLRILEAEVQALIEVAYGIKPPSSPKKKTGKRSRSATPEKKKLVTEPYVEVIKPNRIEKLVSYQPCAYCVEDYITNLVYETPAVPATHDYIQSILHLEEDNTKYGIYTLTVPEKRHPYRGPKKE